MRIFLSLFIMLTFFAVNISAQNATKGAEITFAEEVIDYGTIDQDADGVRNFTFTNTGDAPLIITSAKGSCGCTVPTYPDEPILPGKTATIKVKYDTHRLGAFSKTVTISSNATNGAQKILTIKGKVQGANG